MNSDKAAAVRDSVNGCPDVLDPENTREYNREVEKTEFGKDVTYVGEFLKPDPSKFRPAYIEQSGTVSDGEGTERPVYVVVLETLWHDPTDVRSLSPEMVYEIAKHDCRVRFYPPEHRLGGSIWIVDHFTEDLSDTDGDRCPECDSTYFKMRDGEPECARCGYSDATASEQKKLVTDGGVDRFGDEGEHPRTYHTLSRGERDHLLAAAQLQGDAPSGMDVQRQVEALRVTERPSNKTTYDALNALVGYGWIGRERADEKSTAYHLTDRGRDVLDHARREFDI